MRKPLAALTAVVASVGLLVSWHGGPLAAAPPDDDAPAPILPFIERYCISCHGGDEPSGQLSLEGFAPDLELPATRELWQDVRQRLVDGDMPPRRATLHPSPEERAGAIAAIGGALAVAPAPQGTPGRATLRRLNRLEYGNAVRALLGVHLRLERDLPPDDAGYGFDTIGDVLSLPPMLLEKYLDAAERATAAALPLVRPLAARIEAEDCEKTARSRVSGEFVVLVTSGAAETAIELPCDGEYLFRSRVYGDQGGPDLVQVGLSVNGRLVRSIEVAAEIDDPIVLEERVQLSAGRHTFAVSFRNDFYDGDHPDRDYRDRNLGIDWLAVEGPATLPTPTAAERVLLPGQPEEPEDWEESARAVLPPFLRRAYRRPAAQEEVDALLQLLQRAGDQGLAYGEAMRIVVQAVLVSPHFLYKVEKHAPDDGVYTLDDWELASQLAFFLWSSPPDDALLDLAASGALRASLPEQVARMLDDPRAVALVESFAGQWLGLRELEDMRPDPVLFPAFDDTLREAMRVETEMFFEAVMRENRDVRDLLDAPFTFVNERLAEHYGLGGVRGERFRRVRLPDQRGGLLTHASVLTLTSYPNRTSPTQRGKWLLEALLDAPPPDPPPGAGDLPEPTGAHPQSLRERLELHRTEPTCAACHQLMDPLGFSLQRYDAVGRYRLEEGGLPIDASGTYKGVDLDGAADLRRYLRGRGPDFVVCLARKLLIYALGRDLNSAERAAIDQLVAGLGPDYRFRALVTGLVELDAFSRRSGEDR